MSKLEEHLKSVGWHRVEHGFGWAHPADASTQVFEHAVEDAFDRMSADLYDADAQLAQQDRLLHEARIQGAEWAIGKWSDIGCETGVDKKTSDEIASDVRAEAERIVAQHEPAPQGEKEGRL